MFAPGWEQGCPSCSFMADHADGMNVHLAHRDVTLLANYGVQPFPTEEAPGISVFYKDDSGHVFHTYSTYGRGVEVMMGTYNLLDLTPKGRDERDVDYKMEWVRHHDRYAPAPVAESARATRSCCEAHA